MVRPVVAPGAAPNPHTEKHLLHGPTNLYSPVHSCLGTKEKPELQASDKHLAADVQLSHTSQVQARATGQSLLLKSVGSSLRVRRKALILPCGCPELELVPSLQLQKQPLENLLIQTSALLSCFLS